MLKRLRAYLGRSDALVPPPASLSAPSAAADLLPGPPLAADSPPERRDTPAERARLVRILLDDRNLSGVSGYELLDRWHIPPETIELALRDAQIARAERGLGASRAVGGPW